MAAENRTEEFWDRLEDCRAGMLEIGGRAVPMSHNLEPEDGNIWFLTARGTDMAKAAESRETCSYIVSNDSEALYAQIVGALSVSEDKEILEEVWSPMASNWFEGGKDDPDLVLMKLAPQTAEVWLGPDSGLKFIWDMAKGKITGEEPDYGDHFKLTF